MFVKNVMTTDLVTVSPEMSWQDAARLLLQHRLAGAPVVDASGRLVGILSEKDLFRGLFPSYDEWEESPELFTDFEAMEQRAAQANGRTVADVMNRRLITAAPDTPVLKIGALMSSSGIHRVPVLDGGKLVGMVSRGDIYRAIMKKYLNVD